MTTESFSSDTAFWTSVRLPPWWLVLIEAILLIIIGIFLLVNPYQTFVSIIWVLGIYWVFRGALNLISLIWDRRLWGWKIIAGVLGIIAGWIVWQNPVTSAVILSQITVWMLALIALFFGISDLIRAFKGGGWVAAVIGVISIIFAILLLNNTLRASASLPIAMGILAIFGGIITLFGSFRLRSLEHTLEDLSETAGAQLDALADRAQAAAADAADEMENLPDSD
ncbi:MAG: HdeD family acid-resistance protein [Candidatus Promineifilaceae bacterium]|jgi:uncharacterized membrane protein HdeD (DUF308 family)